MKRRGRGGWLLLLLALVLLRAATAQAQERPPISYDRYDALIQVQPDGTLLITEHQEVRFDGEFSKAFAEIPLAYTTGIEVVRLTIEGATARERSTASAPGTYSVEREGEALFVEWRYPPTAPGDVRTFELTYRVTDGLWVYEAEQVMEWRAIPSDRSGVPITASRVTVELPETPPPDNVRYTAYGAALGYEARLDGNRVIFDATQPLPDGTAFQVQVGFPPTMTSATRQRWQTVEEEETRLRVAFPDYRTELWIQADGSATIEEQQRVRVEEGILRGGKRLISYAYLDGIRDVQLWEGDRPLEEGRGCPYCFGVSGSPREWIRYDGESQRVQVEPEQAGEMEVSWSLPDLVRGEEATYRLRYTVEGLIAPQEDGTQRFTWHVLPTDSHPMPDHASALLHLPPGVSADQVRVEGGRASPQGGGTVLVEPDGPLSARPGWPVTVVLPAGATTAPTPAWQQALQAATAQEQGAIRRKAQIQLGAGLGGLLLLVLGLLGTGMAWYTRGRDHPQPLTADTLPEPPSNLPPAIVAYLMDERPSSRGALASLFHLGTLGLLTIQQRDDLYLSRPLEAPLLEEGTRIEQPDGTVTLIPTHLRRLYNAIAPAIPARGAASFSSLASSFTAALPAVYQAMGEEVRPYFDGLPGAVRTNWLARGQWLIIVGLLLSLCAAFLGKAAYGWVILAPTAALAVVGVAIAIVSRWMPRRTEAGSEEAMRWHAFRAYLQGLKGYGSLAEAQRVLESYFPYAVAFGVESVVLRQAEAAGAPPPAWSQGGELVSVPRDELPREPGQPQRPLLRRVPSVASTPVAAGPGPKAAGGGVDKAAPALPRSMQNWSDRFAQGITLSDSRLATLLTDATRSGDASETPFRAIAGTVADAGRGSLELLEAILESSMESSDSGGSRSSGGSWSSSSSSSSSSFDSSRDSSDRRSGGGGSRGFG